MEVGTRKPVLILGAGINGCAVARELALNGIPAWIVDTNDISSGATSQSSRLIHGGLRYLEFGDFRLVRESLRERSRLLKLAPQFVEPLRLYIPVQKRFAGVFRSVFRFLGGNRFRPLYWMSAPFRDATERGMWLVRIGLWLYDRFAAAQEFPKHSVFSVEAPHVPRVDASQFRWLCAYSDAQIRYPERFVLALLEDAREIAEQKQIEFRVLTHHTADCQGSSISIRQNENPASVHQLEPSLIVNATGAWGDLTLGQLKVPAQRIFGGTKGSHFVTHDPQLVEALGGQGLYAEATDERLVFVLPFDDSVLVGTTDERFEDRPENAIASQEELDYLLGMVNGLFPTVHLKMADIDFHYSGVRPLPLSVGGRTASIPRGHSIEVHQLGDLPVLTLVGGKLTTCRAFGEDAANRIFELLSVERTANTRKRPVPGGENYPEDPVALEAEWNRLAEISGLTIPQVRAVWRLCGTRTAVILRDISAAGCENLAGTQLPLAFVHWVITHEWVVTLDDLVERRLMLLYQPEFSQATLRELAQCLVEQNRLNQSQVEDAILKTTKRLSKFHGKTLSKSPTPLDSV